MELLAILLFSPLFIAIADAFRAIILFGPTMVLLHYVHDFLPWVPALGWWETSLVLMLVWMLIPIEPPER